jgi:hypothetical protein
MSRLILKRLRFKDLIPTTTKQRNDTSNLNAKSSHHIQSKHRQDIIIKCIIHMK